MKTGHLRSLVSKRSLIVNQAPLVSSSTSQNNSISKRENINVADLPNLKTTDLVSLEAVGVPPSVMSVSVPPSVQVFIRRGSMLTLRGNPKHMTSGFEFLSPFQRLIYGNYVSGYQKVIATEPFSMLVTSNSPTLLPRLFLNSTPKSFASVVLDGVNDWAVLKRDALHIFAGPSLNVGMYKIPKKISRQLAKRVDLTTKALTGLFKWNRPGYTFVSGRGVLGLVGNGLVYTATLLDGEEVLINKHNLVALSVNGPYDLQNCVVKYDYPVPDVNSESTPDVAQVKSWRDFVIRTKYYFSKLTNFGLLLQTNTSNYLVGNQDFVRVIGPRTVLLQSGASSNTYESNFSMPSLSEKIEPAKKTAADYLNYVTIDPVKGATIESTPNFRNPAKK